MNSLDTYKTFSKTEINGKRFVYFDINKLLKRFSINPNDIPISIKILLENLLRNEDGISIKSNIIDSFCKQISKKDKNLEIFFYPSRVLMQDFTGVPAVADLAAMRDALKNKGIVGAALQTGPAEAERCPCEAQGGGKRCDSQL